MSFSLQTQRRGRGAFTLVEVMIAAGLVAMFMTSVFLLNSRCLSMLKAAKEAAAASQALQERVEQLRIGTWTQITNGSYLSGGEDGTAFYGEGTVSSQVLPPIEETITISSYPGGSHWVTVIRDDQVVLAPTGTGAAAALEDPAVRMIRVDLSISWVGSGNVGVKSYTTTSLIARGGITR